MRRRVLRLVRLAAGGAAFARARAGASFGRELEERHAVADRDDSGGRPWMQVDPVARRRRRKQRRAPSELR